MNWHLIDKKNSVQPTTGNYNDWKTQIADECHHQCIYCAITEARFGGIRNFHVEHWKPKSRFKKLAKDIKNLFLACAICNGFKGDDWPNDPAPDNSLPSYPDPSEINYATLFRDSKDPHQLAGRNVAGTYIVERLFLNRPQLILDRRTTATVSRVQAALVAAREYSEMLLAAEEKEVHAFLHRLVASAADLGNLSNQLHASRPYEPGDDRRK